MLYAGNWMCWGSEGLRRLWCLCHFRRHWSNSGAGNRAEETECAKTIRISRIWLFQSGSPKASRTQSPPRVHDQHLHPASCGSLEARLTTVALARKTAVRLSAAATAVGHPSHLSQEAARKQHRVALRLWRLDCCLLSGMTWPYDIVMVPAGSS